MTSNEITKTIILDDISKNTFSLQAYHSQLSALMIRAAGYNYLDHSYSQHLTAKEWHLLMYPQCGNINFHFNDQHLSVSNRQCLLVPAHVVRQFSTECDESSFVWFHLDRSRFPLDLGSAPQLYSDCSNRLIYEGMEMLYRQSFRDQGGNSLLSHHLTSVLAELIRHDTGQNSLAKDPHQLRLKELMQTISNKLHEPWDCDRMASLLNVSTPHLYRLTQTYFNTQPMALLGRLRMERAAALLLNSDDILELIAEQVGYQSARAFSNAFKKYYGQRPGSFRKTGLFT